MLFYNSHFTPPFAITHAILSFEKASFNQYCLDGLCMLSNHKITKIFNKVYIIKV